MRNIIQCQNRDIVLENSAGYFSLLKNYLLVFVMVFLWVFKPVLAMSTDPVVIKDIRTGGDSTPFTADRLQIGTVVFFEAHDGVNGYELWRSDSTETRILEFLPQ